MNTSFRRGRIIFPKLNDQVDPAKLRIEVADDGGNVIGELELVADNIVNPEERDAIQNFAFWVEEAPRKAQYLREAEEHGNLERVRSAIRDDFDANFFRERRDRGHYEGLGDVAIRQRRMQR